MPVLLRLSVAALYDVVAWDKRTEEEEVLKREQLPATVPPVGSQVLPQRPTSCRPSAPVFHRCAGLSFGYCGNWGGFDRPHHFTFTGSILLQICCIGSGKAW